jgi:quercetin dioxygenase-like cupin family protein
MLLLVLAVGFLTCRGAAQGGDDTPIVAPGSAAKFAAIPNAPKCFTIAVERGDPTKGASVILARFAPECVAPFHWHTPSETAMMVSGALELQMKDEKAMVAHHGDYVYLPPHHIHRATCQGAAPCLVFLVSDGAFDVHWVDAAGQEIPLETAVKSVTSSGTKGMKKSQ